MAKSAQEAGLIGDEVPEGQLVASMEKLMQDGRLLSKDVLPFFAKNLREFASPGLQKAMDSNRVAMGRMVNATKEASVEFFKSGFEEGLTDLFNTTADSIRDLTPLWKALGRIFGSVMKIIARGIQLITPPLRLLGGLLDKITEQFGDLSYVVVSLLGAGLIQSAARMGKLVAVAKAMRVAFLALLAPLFKIVLALGLIEEVTNVLIDRNKKGILFDPNQPSASAGQNIGKTFSSPNLGKGIDFAAPFLNHFNRLGQYFSQDNMGGSTTVVLEVDKEKLGEVVMDTRSSRNAIDTRVHPYLTGGLN